VNRTGLPRIIFITGTDTGVGKTLLTGLLLLHLRQNGCHALAMKPFCSGSRADTTFLAPLAAARKHHRSIRLPQVLRPIMRVANRCQCLLIEGIGGLLVPLGEGFTVRDLIAELGCEVIVVAPNRLGTINHTILTVEALQRIEILGLKTVLMSSHDGGLSALSNSRILAELLAPVPVLPVDFLSGNLLQTEALKKSGNKIKKTLAQILV
jgi:dethiobiotin synthetase